MKRHTLIVALACFALYGCGSERHLDEVKQFVKDSENLPRGRIEPLPEVKPYEPFEYAAYDLTDPFVARKPSGPPPKPNPNDPRLDPNRRKGPLEAFPLELFAGAGAPVSFTSRSTSCWAKPCNGEFAGAFCTAVRAEVNASAYFFWWSWASARRM